MKIEFNPKRNWGRCDFCAKYEAKHTINGGLWWICVQCLAHHYGGEEE